MNLFGLKVKEEILYISMIIFSNVNIYYLHKSFEKYKHVRNIRLFLLILVIINLITFLMIKLQEECKKANLILKIFFLILILLPILLFVTKPNVSYEEGQKLVAEVVKDKGNYTFKPYKIGMNTIATSGVPYIFLLSRRNYYYRLISGKDTLFYMVNPNLGIVVRLKDGFWGEDEY